ncbi:MAG TPA: hypothetical protein PLU71_00840 [Candidatus Dependentiae bacterium]|nr:hypothetical protein [Candidatus Dependentiae bacterium]HRQ62380.1 hypothetical protein [Candidatus Dependentiae bacterium]
MKIMQEVMLDIHHLNAYILEDIPGNIVINNQDNGLYIVSNRLQYVRDMVLLHDIKIQHIYQKKDGTELLLYCQQNKCLMHIDLKQMVSEKINITGELNKFAFTPLFLWNDAVCLLGTQNHIYAVDILQKNIERATEVTVRENYHTFYQCWNTYRMQQVMFWDQTNFVVVIREHDHIKVIFTDPRHHQHQRPILLSGGDSITDVRYRQDRILVIRDQRIEVMDVLTGKQGSYTIEEPYMFVQARFLEKSNSTFVALCQNPEDEKHAQVRLYTVVA